MRAKVLHPGQSLIGFRALRMAGDARRVGVFGFGAAARIVAQLCR